MDVKLKVGFLFNEDNDWIFHHFKGLSWLPANLENFEYEVSFDYQDLSGLDVLFILGYTKILPETFLDSNKLNLIVHESALPKGKGFSPVQWQILEGVNEIPVCLLEATKEVDSGAIYEKASMKFNGNELMDEIRVLQAKATKELIVTFLKKYPNILKKEQEGASTYLRKRTIKDDRLDIDKTIREQFNQLRISDNNQYPVYFEINGIKYYLKITKA